MTFFWLLVWLLSDTPHLQDWNKWVISLIVCIVIDVIGSIEVSDDHWDDRES